MDEDQRPGAVAFRHVLDIRGLIGTKVGIELSVLTEVDIQPGCRDNRP